MKEVKIIVKIQNDKIGTIMKTTGFDKANISDQLEIAGILENLKYLQLDRLKTLGRKSI